MKDLEKQRMFKSMDDDLENLVYGKENELVRNARRSRHEGIISNPYLNAFVPGIFVYRHIKNISQEPRLNRLEKISYSTGLIIGEFLKIGLLAGIGYIIYKCVDN